MSELGADWDEMGRFPDISDGTIDRLLAGKAPADEELGPLAAFIEDVRGAYLEVPGPAVERWHLAAIAEAAQLTGPATVPARRSGAQGRLGLPARRRRPMLSTLFASLAAKVSAAAAAAVLATGGLAAAGALPDPAQQAIADVAQKVGVSLPSPREERRQNEGANGRRVDGAIREVLENEELEGREKGDAVSDAADRNRRDGEAAGESRPAPGDPATPSGNPTGFDSSSQPQGNPTGYGQDAQPSGNPTGFGDAGVPSGGHAEGAAER